ncbi:uncharacterized protein K441DRAFT_127815 [Cenococcum geophilum 1.58]|uniref:uncharacterized protein n=1 Tax=Cenococcum geophilum 1.58 TaxID=794803 RepID=UPI00358EDDA3|nr:hypothetical protein K441DRAFT_127815 [Cenococcum geophilum 1.58]
MRLSSCCVTSAPTVAKEDQTPICSLAVVAGGRTDAAARKHGHISATFRSAQRHQKNRRSGQLRLNKGCGTKSSESVFCAKHAGRTPAYHIRAKDVSERPTHHSICAHDTTRKANQPPPILHPITTNLACLGILFDHRIIGPGEISIANLLLVSVTLVTNFLPFIFYIPRVTLLGPSRSVFPQTVRSSADADRAFSLQERLDAHILPRFAAAGAEL